MHVRGARARDARRSDVRVCAVVFLFILVNAERIVVVGGFLLVFLFLFVGILVLVGVGFFFLFFVVV